MKNLIKSVAAAAVLAAPALAFGATYEVDQAHSAAHFTVKHMMVANVRGDFGKVSGTVNVDEKDITKSSVDVVIDASSIDTRNASRDGHLKSADFFDVANHPNLTFKSTKVEKDGEGKLKVTGNLTIRNVTKSVVLDVEGPSAELKGLDGSMRVGATATTKINRKDFGLNWNKALESGGVLVGDEVQVSLDFEGVRKQAAADTAKDTK